jgi:hypothetical protein
MAEDRQKIMAAGFEAYQGERVCCAGVIGVSARRPD